MSLRDALNDYKRHSGDETRFPGERRTLAGRFSGRDGRLVYVGPDGRLCDYSYPLSGLSGIDRSRFGVRGDETVWFDDCDSTQRYHDDTTLVVTEHSEDDWSVIQYDLTVGDAHVTHFEGDGAATEIVAYVGFTPDGRETRIGQLRHGDAVEVFHADERDFLAASPAPTDLGGQVPEGFAELLDPEPHRPPRGDAVGRYEESRLSGELVCSVPLDGGATLVSLSTDRTETPREDALDRVRYVLAEWGSPDALAATAEDRSPSRPATPHATAVENDLRVLSLLSAESGARIAGPDFDPFYAHSGGYGYTWFRDDAEIARFLLDADGYLAGSRTGARSDERDDSPSGDPGDFSLSDWHERSARFYCRTQRDDGTWPHRVWPRDGTLAPGWANARLEPGADVDYQADQTGSVVTFLAAYLRRLDSDDRDSSDDRDAVTDATVDVELETAIRATLRDAIDGLDDALADDGLPVRCQNAWENATGRFAHTAATYLHAYAALARAPLPADVRDRAADRAETVATALDDLWTGEFYALRLDGDERDDRVDSSSLALAAAHREYAAVADVDDERLERLVTHVETTLDELRRDPDESEIRGLARFEGDDWRRREQEEPKIWTVSTAWGAHAATELADLLESRDDPRSQRFARRGRDLLALVLPEGPLCLDSGYLPEQVFDDGTPDSATPLGWPHAIRLATVASLSELDALELAERAADD